MADERAIKLHSTTDARVWADEFCNLFSIIMKDGELVEDSRGVMLGWFANAIETGRGHS
jgi:hypothetical protein